VRGPPWLRVGAWALARGMGCKEEGKEGRGDVEPSTQGVGRGSRWAR